MNGLTSDSWSHTCTGNDRALIVGISGWDGGSSLSGVTATYNGVSMTKIASTTIAGSNQVVIWGLLNPASGANTVAISSIPASFDELGGGSVSLTGVSQRLTLGATNGAIDGTPSLDLTGVAANDMCVDIMYDGGTTAVATGTQRVNVSSAGGVKRHRMQTKTGTGTVAMSWTSVTDVAIAAIVAKAANAPPPFLQPRRFINRRF